MTRNDVLRELARARSLAHGQFVGLDLAGIDFAGADLTGAVFRRCRLAGARFDNAACAGVRFDRSAGLMPATIAALERAGAVVERPAVQFAPILGWLAVVAAAVVAIIVLLRR